MGMMGIFVIYMHSMLPWQYYIINMSWFFQGPPRLSGLEAPIMMLTGHEGDIFTAVAERYELHPRHLV
jgi:hypothetical protein